MKMTLKHCLNCTDDFYNDKNPYGVKRCWHFDGAKLEKRLKIGVWQNPPYLKMKPQLEPTCKHIKGFVLVKPEAIGKDGYWKH